ncbi:hypothetical protein D3C87_1534530 [compost metagenome]
MNLSQIGELSKAIKEKEKTIEGRVSAVQKAELVEAVSGKTTQETQRDLAQMLNIEIKLHETKRVQQDESLRCELTLSKTLAEKIERCKERASHKIHEIGDGHTLAALIEVLADAFLKNDVLSDIEETEIMQDENLNLESKMAAIGKLKSDLNATALDKVVELRVNKTLTPKIKREIIQRDKCCKYVDPLTGKQCGSSYFQQIDHKTSQWAGGNHAKVNLQVLCAGHNRLKYQKESQIRLL